VLNEIQNQGKHLGWPTPAKCPVDISSEFQALANLPPSPSRCWAGGA
jgi:hypothetical protein